MSDLRGDRPVRVSGAFDIDMSKVVEEAARRAAESLAGQMGPALGQYVDDIIQAIMPALAKMNQSVETLAGLMFPAGLMGQDDARATLWANLPAGTSSPAVPAEEVADFQLQRLTEAGYAVVPVAGAALEHAIKVAQHRQRLAEQDHREALRRADTRLTQATLDGIEDPWHEDD